MNLSRNLCFLFFLAFIFSNRCRAADSAELCAFVAPHFWHQNSTRWNGPCQGGYAEGVGVLKEYDGQNVKRFFFGLMRHGQPDMGVIEQTDGYIAGRFKDGEQILSEDRQDFIDAFLQAEKAAEYVASRFEKIGNVASAKFYWAKAKSLRDQID